MIAIPTQAELRWSVLIMNLIWKTPWADRISILLLLVYCGVAGAESTDEEYRNVAWLLASTTWASRGKFEKIFVPLFSGASENNKIK